MGIELETFSLKVKNETTGVLEEPAFLKGKDAKSVYAYSVDGGNNWTETNGVEEMSFTIPYFGLGKKLYWAVDVKNSNGYRSIWNGGDIVDIFTDVSVWLGIKKIKHSSVNLWAGRGFFLLQKIDRKPCLF